MKTRCRENATNPSSFDWIASSYLPDAARLVGNETILDDKYGIYGKNRSHWLMGPSPNALPQGSNVLSGDVTDAEVVNALGNAAHQRFREKDGATLYTSDIGRDIPTANLNQQEELTSDLNFGQIVSGLLALAIGGTLITKQFTFFNPFSRSLIAIVASLFKETYITKPTTSRPGNSEIYLVAKGFKGISSELSTALLDRCEAYKALDKMPTIWGSLIDPPILAQIDGELLAIAQEVHGEQQVAFLKEVVDAYRIFDSLNDREMKELVAKEEKAAQMKWLADNPILVISTNQNLSQTVGDEAIPQASRAILNEEPMELEVVEIEPEESILIPEEEEEKKEGEGEGEESEGENSSSSGKKTIKFTV